MTVSRRYFLKGAGAVSAGAVFGVPNILLAQAAGRSLPSNRVTLGMIGYGRQAKHSNLKPFLTSPDVQVVAMCDVDSWRLEEGCKDVNEYYAARTDSGTYKGCSTYRDYRELLAREDIDGVMISTPDHWHAIMSIEAAKAGKDVACEKPITLSIHEGRLVSDTIRDYGRIFRTDTEVRSVRTFQHACELVRSGKIGKLHSIHTGVPHETMTDMKYSQATPVPPELDFEMWLGPAPEAAYAEDRVHPRHTLDERPGWMRVRDYCDGIICNWGTHLNDIAQWANGTEKTGPVEVEAAGVYSEHPLWNVLTNFEAKYRYANGVQLFYKMDKPYVRFEGDRGWVLADYESLTASDPGIAGYRLNPEDTHLPLISEKTDFIECVKTRRRPVIDAECGHRTTSICHMAHISIQLGGEKLQWDPVKEVFIGNDAANRLKCRQAMRPPWKL